MSPARAQVATASDLSWVFPIREEVALFRQQGFVRLHGVLDQETISFLFESLRPLVTHERRKGAYGAAFRYLMNGWLQSENVRRVTMSRRLAGIAAALLGVPILRLSHDQALFKDAGDPGTPIHADQYHWPISSDNALSVWIPLSPVDSKMGPLSFFAGSHLMEASSRDNLECCDQRALADRLSAYPESIAPYEVGDVSFHYGWTFHRAGPNLTEKPRNAFGVVYMDGDVRLTAPRGGRPIEALSAWSPGARVGELLNSDRHPIVFQ